MSKINLVIADEEELYLKQLTNYFVKSTKAFEVYSFSKKDSLERFITTEKVDILMLSEELKSAAADGCAAEIKLLLSEDGEDRCEGYETIEKYQKTSDLYHAVMLAYGKKSGKADSLVQGDRKTKLLAVYSPVGGCGKTTLSLLLANQLAKQGQTVFYQNYEHINSTAGILPPSANVSLSDLLVAVRSGEKGIGLRLFSQKYTEPQYGFSYVNPPDSSLELNEVTLEEQLQLLQEIIRLGQFDAVVLDLDGELNADKLRLLQLCDKVIVPFTAQQLSVNKLLQLFREISIREELADLEERMLLVVNMANAYAEAYLRESGVSEKHEVAMMIPASEQAADIAGLLRADSAAVLPLTELIRRMMQEQR